MRVASALAGMLVVASAWPAAAAAVCEAKQLTDSKGAPLRPLRVDTVQSPRVSEEVEVEIGQPVLSTARLALVATQYTLPEPLVVKAPPKTEDVTITFPAGVYRVETSGLVDNGDTWVSFLAPNAVVISNKTGKPVKRTATFTLRGSAKPMVNWNATFSLWWTPIDLLPGEAGTCIATDSKNFRREIVYSGKRGTSIALLYREFVNDMARPAFSQELTYDLADGEEIGYRGARFKVLKATNTSIRFIVLKPIDDATV